MNMNQKALELYESNQYEEALRMFHLALEESRDVQALTNLAWITYHEKEDYQLAVELLTEALLLNPLSHFPYNLLGQIYLAREEWVKAVDVLKRGLQIKATTEAYNNLAVAYYHLRELDAASQFFLKGSNAASDYALYSHVRCLIELEKNVEAKKCLASFDEEDDEFVGSIELAELYFELKDYEEAVRWYEKGWDQYYKQPLWVEAYIYALYKNNKIENAEQILNLALKDKQVEIEDNLLDECNEDWTELDKERNIQRLTAEFNQYTTLLERILECYIPTVSFSTSLHSECYLFGCLTHENSEYLPK